MMHALLLFYPEIHSYMYKSLNISMHGKLPEVIFISMVLWAECWDYRLYCWRPKKEADSCSAQQCLLWARGRLWLQGEEPKQIFWVTALVWVYFLHAICLAVNDYHLNDAHLCQVVVLFLKKQLKLWRVFLFNLKFILKLWYKVLLYLPVIRK